MRPPAPIRVAAAGRSSGLEALPLVQSDGLLQAGRQRSVLSRGRRLGDPHAGFALRILDELRQPLEQLAGSLVEREGDQPVSELYGPELTQPAPHRNAWRRRLAREPVREKYPERLRWHACMIDV